MIRGRNLEKAFEYVKLGKFRKVSKKLWEDRDFVMEAIKINPHALGSASPVLRIDPEIAFFAVERSSSTIIYVGKKLQDNKELVLKAVSKDGHVLAYISDRLKNDEDVVLAAIKNNGFAIIEANERFINIKKYALIALKQNGFVMKYYKDEFKQNPQFIKASLIGITRVDVLNIQKINLKYFGDKNFVKELKSVLEEYIKKIEEKETDNPTLKPYLLSKVARAKIILEDKQKAYKLFENMEKQIKEKKNINREEIEYSTLKEPKNIELQDMSYQLAKN